MSSVEQTQVVGRCGAPPPMWRAVLGALMLAIPAPLLFFLPGTAEGFQYDRAAIEAGEIWRLVTCHWTHWSMDHLVWDLAAFLILAVIAWSTGPRRLALTLGLSTLAIPLTLWVVLPEMTTYRGLSGIDSALFVLVAITVLKRELAAGGKAMALAVALVLLGFCGKIAFELATGSTLFTDSSDFVPIPLAHVIGAACALPGSSRRLASTVWRPTRAVRSQFARSILTSATGANSEE